jgi:hypothetical protein
MKTYDQVVNQAALSNLHGYFGGGDMYQGYRNFASAADFIYGVTNDQFFEDIKAAFDEALQHMNRTNGKSDDAVAYLKNKAVVPLTPMWKQAEARVSTASADLQDDSFDDWEKMDRGWN